MKKLNSLILNSTVNFLDFIYSGRSLQRFWVLEVIARSPYFAFLSVLHFKESLGIKNEKTMILMKEHFYQAINETEHLKDCLLYTSAAADDSLRVDLERMSNYT